MFANGFYYTEIDLMRHSGMGTKRPTFPGDKKKFLAGYNNHCNANCSEMAGTSRRIYGNLCHALSGELVIPPGP